MKIAVVGGTGAVGRHVTAVARQRGHDPVVLTRSAGFDLLAGTGLDGALEGVEAVIDVVNTTTTSAAASKRFFGTTTTTLLRAEAEAGVRHHVALSIVNARRVAAGYYAGKALQEKKVEQGPVPWTMLRSTQFHDFAAQTLRRGKVGAIALVPVMRTRPIAAREVAERLVDLVLGEPRGQVGDLGGPREEQLVDMVRAYARATHSRAPIVQFRLPGGMWAAMRDGALLPSSGAERGRQTFAEWLENDVRRRPS